MTRESVVEQVKSVSSTSREVADKNPEDQLLSKIATALEHVVKQIDKEQSKEERNE